MATSKRPTMLRLPDKLFEKVRYLAYLEHRSVNMEIEFALEAYIKAFEATNGPLQVPQAPPESEE